MKGPFAAANTPVFLLLYVLFFVLLLATLLSQQKTGRQFYSNKNNFAYLKRPGVAAVMDVETTEDYGESPSASANKEKKT